MMVNCLLMMVKCSSMMVKWAYDHTLISPSLTYISPSLTSILPSLTWSVPQFAFLTIIEKLHRLQGGTKTISWTDNSCIQILWVSSQFDRRRKYFCLIFRLFLKDVKKLSGLSCFKNIFLYKYKKCIESLCMYVYYKGVVNKLCFVNKFVFTF